MAIKPILFNTEMVRAILDGRKTCTRRIIKPQWEECPHCKYVHKEYIYDKLAENVYCAKCGYPLVPERRAPYNTDDILYVRETWKKAPNGYYYYEDWQRNDIADVTKWKPSIHMPKEAARIWLKVTDVKVERLQDIDGKGCVKEGIEEEPLKYVGDEFVKGMFHDLWDSTIKKSDLNRYGWDANPWVWFIEFERCEKPEIN